MKMYILIPEDVPDEFVPVSAAHAALATYLKFQDDPATDLWLNDSFKKVVVKAPEEFLDLIGYHFPNEIVEIHENNLDNKLTAVGVKVMYEYPGYFMKMKLWKPKKQHRPR